MATVSHVVNDDGSHSLTVKVDGVPVPLVTVPSERVATIVAQAKAGSSSDNESDEEGGS